MCHPLLLSRRIVVSCSLPYRCYFLSSILVCLFPCHIVHLYSGSALKLYEIIQSVSNHALSRSVYQLESWSSRGREVGKNNFFKDVRQYMKQPHLVANNVEHLNVHILQEHSSDGIRKRRPDLLVGLNLPFSVAVTRSGNLGRINK